MMNFNNLHENRKAFLEENKTSDHVITIGKNKVLLSAPHGVSQVRLGKCKYQEIGTITTLLFLKDHTKCFTISKTKNNHDDANFDNVSPYKTSIEELIKNHKIKYIVDFHGLAPHRGCDINFGTHLGQNIKADVNVFDRLNDELIKNNFVTCIDQPFMGGPNTIAGSVIKNHPDLWALQIEINSSITNKKENFEKYKLLLEILTDWLNSIDA